MGTIASAAGTKADQDEREYTIESLIIIRWMIAFNNMIMFLIVTDSKINLFLFINSRKLLNLYDSGFTVH